MSIAYRAREHSARGSLAYLGGFFAYGIGLSALYARTGLGLPCPLRSLTGWECPLCGATRMGSALLHGDLASAFADNPVVLLGLVLLTALGLVWSVEVLRGPRLRLPLRWSERLSRVHPTRWLVLGLSASVVYTVLRNLF